MTYSNSFVSFYYYPIAPIYLPHMHGRCYPFSSLKILYLTTSLLKRTMQASTTTAADSKEQSKPKEVQSPSVAAGYSKSSRKRGRDETSTEDGGKTTTPVVQNNNHPAHAPIITNDGMVEFSLAAIHKHLICSLCSGYYKDPYTITDCLHTFCKSCLLYAVACGCHECPECQVYLGGDLLKVAVLDHCMQDVRNVTVLYCTFTFFNLCLSCCCDSIRFSSHLLLVLFHSIPFIIIIICSCWTVSSFRNFSREKRYQKKCFMPNEGLR
jgi:hypothetical protein